MRGYRKIDLIRAHQFVPEVSSKELLLIFCRFEHSTAIGLQARFDRVFSSRWAAPVPIEAFSRAGSVRQAITALHLGITL
jgi:hypothetical protein